MPRRPRRNHSPVFKSKVALAAVKGDKTILLYGNYHGLRASDFRPTAPTATGLPPPSCLRQWSRRRHESGERCRGPRSTPHSARHVEFRTASVPALKARSDPDQKSRLSSQSRFAPMLFEGSSSRSSSSSQTHSFVRRRQTSCLLNGKPTFSSGRRSA